MGGIRNPNLSSNFDQESDRRYLTSALRCRGKDQGDLNTTISPHQSSNFHLTKQLRYRILIVSNLIIPRLIIHRLTKILSVDQPSGSSMNLDSLQMHITGGVVAASRQWRRVCQTTLMNYGVSEACAGPLLMIARLGEGVRQVTVAQACGLESPSLVRLLDQLGKANLVQRTEDPTDRRAKALSLTNEGRMLANSIEEELIRLRRDVFSSIDPADLEATLRVFKAFANASPMGPELSS